MLINTINGLKEVLGGVQNEMYWRTWKPFVRQAEISYIIPTIGEELYAQIDALIDASTDFVTGSNVQKSLIERLRYVLGHYVTMESQLSMLLLQGDGGTVVASPPNMQAPGKWMVTARIAEARDKADREMEAVLQFLEKNKSSFATWTASDAYTISAKLFLSSATQFTDYFPAVRNSRRMYLALRSYIEKSEREYVETLIGNALFNDLKTKIANGDVLAPHEKSVVTMLRTIVANDAFRRAVPYLNLNSDFRLVSEADGIETKDALMGDRLTAIKADTEKEVQNESKKLKNYLDENASSSVFAPYFQSDLYVPKTKKVSRLRVTNEDPTMPFVL
ncbi:MAG: hypothetical protein EAZ80_01595 [Runella slithyformis]|nr:MAG: hypothetical protein EAZ80_01595 [Runella slithyformis]TAF48677.1 MAG: hypothetical protein EAZ63_03760 [Runella slithyformis]